MAARLSVALAVLAIMTAPAMAEEDGLAPRRPAACARRSTEVAKDFEAAGLGKVQAKFGASGLLKDEIAAGAKAEVFASANMEHPQALAAEKRSGPCGAVRPQPAVRAGAARPRGDAGRAARTVCSTLK
jgi:ABC-type molybdate transport system substrate-binding protein